ncbi:MAG TPA: CaiB/BaiF CoA-transferase family protein [Verrucomicrobiae bacterium]|nr:CaiB/BaiF CoA-transferase family protein [Verrucomicrobiae bacterium]
MKNVLDGIRVIEMTEALAGPYCAMLLGDLGADVIKIERPGIGDQARGWGPPFVGEMSAYFLSTNRNKRSIVLDYNQPNGLEALHKLIATADIFITNQPSLESLQKRKLDAACLRERHPKLIYCGISGYGSSGPKAGSPGYDILAQAEAGLMSFTGEETSGPMRYPIAIADMTCGIYAAMGILAALFAREKTGQGQLLDMALFDSQLTWLANAGSSFLNAGVTPQRWGNAHPNIVPYEMFSGSDGVYFVIGVGTEALWQKFAAIIDTEADLYRDSRFRINAERIKHRAELIPILQETFSKKSASEWLERFAAAGIPAAKINGVSEALNDIQAKARGLVVQLEHPILGSVKSIANPMRLSGTPVTYRLAPPFLGEHTDQILQDLGYTTKETAALANSSK